MQGLLCLTFGYRVTDTNGVNTWVFNDNMVNVTFASPSAAEGILALGDTPIGNEKVDLYFGEERSIVISTTINPEGEFTANISAQLGNQLEKGGILQIVATKDGKTFGDWY